jgi:hypothetical protein
VFIKLETKRLTQESLGFRKSITFMGIVVIWGNAFTRILRFFRREVAKNVKVFATSPNYSVWSCVATVDSNGRTIFVADAHRDDGKRFIVRSDEMLSAFLELERVTHELVVSVLLGDDTHWDTLP